LDNSRYRERLKSVIPGGSHTYSRGSDQFPASAPSILERGKGSFVWDHQGRKYLDFGMGLRSVTLGYANREILTAANRAMNKGNSLTLPNMIELEAAEKLVSLIPSIEMVKFAKNGSNATSGAVKIARAYTNRDIICVPKQQPFFSFDDWFISTTPITKGIPEFENLTKTFDFRNLDSLRELFNKFPGRIACVITEAITADTVLCNNENHSTYCDQDSQLCYGNKDQLNAIKEICHENGALFILDEIITGFRLDLRGAQNYYGVEPDLTTFGKAMANGFALAAVGGKSEFMNVGGIDVPGKERTFLMSSTHGAEMVSLGAFLQVVRHYEKHDTPKLLWQIARNWKSTFDRQIQSFGLHEYISAVGTPLNMNIVCRDKDGETSLEFKTLLQQELIRNKVLMPWITFSTSLGRREMQFFESALAKALEVYSRALSDGISGMLDGDAIKPVFRKHN
jgi:glutamate-1-semialdehyde 2,1-aminomutase